VAVGSGILQPVRPRASGGGNPPPTGLEDGGGGGGSGWVNLLRASNDIEAHLLVGRLGEAGVEARIMRDKGAPSAWLYGASKPWAPVNVMVRLRQLQDAKLVLAEVAFSAPSHAEPPACERDWRVPVMWWAAALALGALFTGAALASTATSLRSCAVPVLCND
jgi:hypothetical protein